MRRWKYIASIFVMLWLPLQGIAAVAMPFCRHALPDTSMEPAMHGERQQGSHAQHEHAADHDGHDAGADAPDPGSSLACNDCGVCHLACAPAVAPASSFSASNIMSGQQIAGNPSEPRAFVPEQPKRPPLRG
jgi:hypothetical protein